MYRKINLNLILDFLTKKRAYLSKRYGVKDIGVFGSYVHNLQNINSDIDILVEFNKLQKTFDNYMEFKFFIQDKFAKEIDLCIKNSIRKEFKNKILNEVVYG